MAKIFLRKIFLFLWFFYKKPLPVIPCSIRKPKKGSFKVKQKHLEELLSKLVESIQGEQAFELDDDAATNIMGEPSRTFWVLHGTSESNRGVMLWFRPSFYLFPQWLHYDSYSDSHFSWPCTLSHTCSAITHTLTHISHDHVLYLTLALLWLTIPLSLKHI